MLCWVFILFDSRHMFLLTVRPTEKSTDISESICLNQYLYIYLSMDFTNFCPLLWPHASILPLLLQFSVRGADTWIHASLSTLLRNCIFTNLPQYLFLHNAELRARATVRRKLATHWFASDWSGHRIRCECVYPGQNCTVCRFLPH